MLAKKTLRTQFVTTFVVILGLSLVATVVTYFVGYRIFTFLEYDRVYPANYFEKQIPAIETEIRQLGPAVFQEEDHLDQLVPAEGIRYQVMDEDGAIIYGTNQERLVMGREDLYARINTTDGVMGTYFTIIPIFSTQGELKGAVSLAYKLTPSYPRFTDRLWLLPLGYLVVFSPFVFIILFTIFFAKKLASNIGEPVNLLIEASNKVKDQDLDFSIDYNADNELGKLCTAFEDMKNELKESLLTLWRVEQEKHYMVAALAHDLKTPFSLIQGYSEALLNDMSDMGKTSRYLQVILENSRRGTGLVTEMLYAAELTDGVHESAIMRTELKPFLEARVAHYRAIADSKEVQILLDVDLGGHAEKAFRLDPSKLERVLDNIVMNSLHYTPKDGCIHIVARVEDHELRMIICDTGKGFTHQDLAHLFDKFYRGNDARPGLGGNSGLGLYIVKKLVDIQGGTINAFNKPEGACLEFTLPLPS